MNKSGFTTVELILTMVLVITITATITTVTYTYRDQANHEEVVTDVETYKNTVTKIIYDDILNSSNKVVKLEHDTLDANKFYLVHEDNSKTTLTIISTTNKVGINFDGIDYLISDTTYESYTMIPSDPSADTSIYSLDIFFKNNKLENNFKIHFAIS